MFHIYFVSQMYDHTHNKKMTTGAVAAMLSTILYYRRFFPYYVYNIVAGLDDEGNLNRFFHCCIVDSPTSHLLQLHF